MHGGLDFVALDIETANSNRGSVCAMGAVVVRRGEVAESYTWLTRPPASLDWFDSFNVMLHGIREEDVRSQPTFADRLSGFIDKVGDLPVIAHNAAFDVGALRNGCDAVGLTWPSLTYACSLVMSRRELDLPSYRLPVVAASLGITLEHHHDAESDALAAAQIVLSLARRREVSSLWSLLSALNIRPGRLSRDSWSGCCGRPGGGTGGEVQLPPHADLDADPEHPLYGQVIVFTGALSVRREEVWARVAALGATPEKNVTKRTTMLVVGDGFLGNDVAEFGTGKAAKAAMARAKGQRIEVLTEEDLTVLLADTRTEGGRAVLSH